MKTKLIGVILLIPTLLAAGCSFIPPKDLTANETYSGKEVRMPQYGTLTISLESDPLTGASWSQKAKIENDTVIEQTGHKFVPAIDQSPRMPDHEVWTFNTMLSGESTVYLEYRQPFETVGPPLKSFDITVIVTKQ